jgi:hypothetical protein
MVAASAGKVLPHRAGLPPLVWLLLGVASRPPGPARAEWEAVLLADAPTSTQAQVISY